MQYEIKQAPFAVLECNLNAGEGMKCQMGGMSWMSRNIQMQTKVGGMKGLLKKAVTGEAIALNHYLCEGENGSISFAMSFPGQILALDVSENTLIAQKQSFMAAEESVVVDIAIQEKLGGGLFGGEGFIMQKFSGQGMVFIEVYGGAVQKELAPGEELVVDTGYVAAMDQTVKMNIERIKGAKNILLGGEGLFNTVLTGPGRVWLQTMPVSALASALYPYMPQTSN